MPVSAGVRRGVGVVLLVAAAVSAPWLHRLLRRRLHRSLRRSRGARGQAASEGSLRPQAPLFPAPRASPALAPAARPPPAASATPAAAAPAAAEPPPPPAPGRLPSRAAILGQDGAPCAQHPSCNFFANVLVVLHINPQRFEWVDSLVELHTHFVPNLALFCLTHPRNVTINASDWVDVPFTTAQHPEKFRSFEERYELLDYLYVGRHRTKIHLVDTRGQSHGDHHDLAVAMRLWPQFEGYFSLQDDDALPVWQRIAAPDRNLSLDHVWMLEPRFPKPWRPQKCRRVGTKKICRVDNKMMSAGVEFKESRDAKDRIQRQLRDSDIGPAVRRLNPCNALTPMYYVPGQMRRDYIGLSRAYLREELFLEHATPTILWAVAGERGALFLVGENYMPHLCGKGNTCRYHYRRQLYHAFERRHDYLHPTRASGELNWRLLWWVRRGRQVATLNLTTLEDFWSECFTCDEYPASTWVTKGRFHSCRPGCKPGFWRGPATQPVEMTNDWGAVVPTGLRALPPGEIEREGFWHVFTVQRIFGTLYDEVNGSTGWPTDRYSPSPASDPPTVAPSTSAPTAPSAPPSALSPPT